MDLFISQGKKTKDLAADLGVDIDKDLVVPADERCGDCCLTSVFIRPSTRI